MKKYTPLIIILALLGIVVLCLTGKDDGKYVVTYDEVEPIEPCKTSKGNHFSKVRLFIENSAGMKGYMQAGSELKDAVEHYVSDLARESDTLELYLVSDNLSPKDATLMEFMSMLGESCTALHTEIPKIFDLALAQINEPNSVNVLITDAILSVKGASADKCFESSKTRVKDTFRSHLKSDPDFGIEIYRMRSTFEGRYYYDSIGKEYGTNLPPTKRPYYMFVMGDKQALSAANEIAPKSSIPHSVEDYYAYSTYTQIPFQMDKAEIFAVMLKHSKAVPVMADLRYTLHEEATLDDTLGYTVAFGDENIRVESIKKVPNSANYTHKIILTLPADAKEGKVAVYFCPPQYPDWLEEANTNRVGSEVAQTMKTPGIRQIIEGISDAFSGTHEFTNGSEKFAPKKPVAAGWEFRLDKKSHIDRASKKHQKSNKSKQ